MVRLGSAVAIATCLICSAAGARDESSEEYEGRQPAAWRADWHLGAASLLDANSSTIQNRCCCCSDGKKYTLSGNMKCSDIGRPCHHVDKKKQTGQQ
mmetsp:Transcript_68255/g.192438  ORF Transcript_68255/g.192438 Transcript_68255/m.192438 type:complete len:97 (-) Transcript_68255:231-521(-)